MSKIDNALSSVFSVDTIPQSSQVVEYKPPEVTPYQPPSSTNEDDSEFEEVKENIEELINKGATALESLTDIAVAEESPRAFEVLNTMLGTLSDLSMKLVELEERKVKLKKLRREMSGESSEIQESGPHTVNNSIVFVGTTDDLHDQIAKRLMEKK